MVDDNEFFCARPGDCPQQDTCNRNIALWAIIPAVRIYQPYKYNDKGCEGYVKRDQS